MATHSLRIDYDAATGDLTVTHRCAVGVAGQTVSHSETVALGDPAAFAASLQALVKANAAEMETRATAFAVQHAAALAKVPQKGVKQVALGGSIGAVAGATTPNKKG